MGRDLSYPSFHLRNKSENSWYNAAGSREIKYLYSKAADMSSSIDY